MRTKPKHAEDQNTNALWNWGGNKKKIRKRIEFPVNEFLSDVKENTLGPGGGIGLGCGAGLGFGIVGGAGYGGWPWSWNHLKLVFGFGIGCGVGFGLGYGQGIGVCVGIHDSESNLCNYLGKN
ncbi:keratin-associated protein 21-1 isoform X1 [Carica papaya]|uniref:keratin-associated protein 21-1 isoform X1 n=1 Tax=Carica papaya TaxID=3649 RepID=UPI000B8CC6F4|nr:keratin-associated protein 21-1 isoform X1 [Carica papaya]